MKNIILLITVLFFSYSAFAQVTIYENFNYTGKSQTLTEGFHDMAVLNSGVGNDKVSSIKIPAGYEVTIYEHDGARGKSVTVKGDIPRYNGTWNDISSSYRVTKTATNNSPATASKTLHYGDIIQLQNGWSNYRGGFLDTRGYQKDFEKTGNFLCVSTATGAKRDGGSGLWKVSSASGKPDGTPVLVGDDVHLLNQWNRNGGYLDTRGYQRDFEKTGNHLCVSTAKASNRDSGSGTWKITSAAGSQAGTAVTESSAIHLQNGWSGFRGGYLDTRGYQRDFEKTGNHLCVSTATSSNRDSGSGIWKVIIAQAR